MADLTETIEDAALTPQSGTTDIGTATARPIDELIAADQYLAGKAAADGANDNGGKKSALRFLRPARVQFPGAHR